jgi:hypothetical protein
VTESPEPLSRLRAWSYRRQLLDRPDIAPAEVLRGVVAVYSSHPTAPLSLMARARAFSGEWLAEAEERRETVRLSAMRGSIHLMPIDTAPMIRAATRIPVEKFAGNLKYQGLTFDDYARLKSQVRERLTEPMTPAEAQEALGVGRPLLTVLKIMGYEGLVLRLGGSLRTDTLRYVLAESWLGAPLEEADPLEGLKWLAMEYLRAFGPARVKDFAWWCGTTQKRAKEALAGAAVVDAGGGLLLPAEDEAAFAAAEPLDPDAIALLPKWDAYTMGYAPDGRQRLLDDAHLPLAYSKAGDGTGATSGDGNPLVLRGGRAVAAWSHRFERDRMRATVAPFEPGILPSADWDTLFGEVGTLLGASSVEVAAPASAG